MPDETPNTGTETPNTPAAPAFDAEALGRQIAEASRAAIKDGLAEAAAAHAPAQVPVQETDALEAVIAPYVNKRAGQAMLVAQLAADKADFYSIDDADGLAERLHFKEEIEKRALDLARNGRPLPRADIFNHLKGEQEDKVQEFRGKRRKAREDRVRESGQDLGGGSLPRENVRVVSAEQAHELQGTGKLDEFLGDKSF